LASQKSNRKVSLVALAAAALASPVALAHVGPSTSTNLTEMPSEAVKVSEDALVRQAVYDPVRRRFISRTIPKPRYLPPNPCRKKKRC
jgi:hypothetical protein